MEIFAENITKIYGDKAVLSGFTHRFRAGTFTSVMGASGCGKTTLLLILADIIKPDSGTVTRPASCRVSAVFQEDRLCENLTVSGNLRLLPRRPDKAEIAAALDSVGLAGCEKQRVRELSGGMKRRIALVRALLAEYDVLFLDEPFKGLDEDTKLQAMNFCKEKTRGRTVILVTHSEQEAEFFGGDTIRLKTDGK